MPKRIVVAVTGASGAAYARRLIACLLDADAHVHLVVSNNGRRLFGDELDIRELSAQTLVGRPDDRLRLHPYDDIGDQLASGSFLTDGMVVVPASGNTIGTIASGLGDNLIARAAAVALKERRRFIVVPREMPLGHVELANLLRLSTAGAIVCPACPGFYLRPKSIDDLVDFVVGRVMDLLHVKHQLNVRWDPK